MTSFVLQERELRHDKATHDRQHRLFVVETQPKTGNIDAGALALLSRIDELTMSCDW